MDQPTLQDYWIEASRINEHHCLCGHKWPSNAKGDRIKCPECKKTGTCTSRFIRVSDIIGMKMVKVRGNIQSNNYRQSFRSALNEVLKYACKPTATRDCDFLIEVMDLFKNRRLLRTKGSLYGMELLKNVRDADKRIKAEKMQDYLYFASYYSARFALIEPAEFVLNIYDLCLAEKEFDLLLDKSIKEFITLSGFRPPPGMEFDVNLQWFKDENADGKTFTRVYSDLLTKISKGNEINHKRSN